MVPIRFWISILVAAVGLILLVASSEGLAATKRNITIYDVRDFADIIRSEQSDVFMGNHELLDDPQLTAVTRKFGPTVIPMLMTFPHQSVVAQADRIPWSSWWYPKKDKSLFEDRSSTVSPLSKYDQLRIKKFRAEDRPAPGSAAEYEADQYSPNVQAWEGLCDAWSLAAIHHAEPKNPIEVKIGWTKIRFEVSDLKALLLKTYEAVDDHHLIYYGQKFTGDFSGWIYPDLLPEQFHRFLEVQLFTNKKAFVMDHDPGVQVWNVPVYKANYLMESVAGDNNAVSVRAWLYFADQTQSSEKDFVGTKQKIREYNYILKGTRNVQGDLIVDSGYWIKSPAGVDSRVDHPDYVIEIPEPAKLIRKSWNPEIEPALIEDLLTGKL